MEEEVQYCKNCKRDISTKNYVIHSVHCERKIKLCDRCLEPVPLCDQEKHEEEFHASDTCSECRISVERWQIEKHKQTCIKRLVPCQYCELEVPLDNLSEHSIACGSRTEQCTKCNKHVMIKDCESHHTKCSVRDTFIRKLARCEYCELEIPLYLLVEHSAACGSRTEQCSRCNKYIMIKDLEKHHTNCLRRMLNFNESISCEYCGGTFNNSSIGIHVEFCRPGTEKCNQCNHYIQREDMDLHHTICEKKKESKLEIPCQYCGGLFPKNFLGDHAYMCGTRLQKCEKCDAYIALKKFETHSNVCKESTSKTNGNCPVCHQSIPLREMNVHSAYCAQIFYETSENEHQNKLNKFALKKEDGEFSVKSTEEKRPQRHLQEDFELCPSCENLIPEQIYHEHLLLCFNGTTQCHICGVEIPRNYEHEHFRECHEII